MNHERPEWTSILFGHWQNWKSRAWIGGQGPFDEVFSIDTGHLIVPVVSDVCVTLDWLQRIVELLAQLTPTQTRERFDHVVFLPAEVFHVEGVVLVQKEQVLGQFFGRPEVGHVDVRVRRTVLRVIRTAVHNRNDAVTQGPVEFFSDVIRAQGIFCGDVKLVLVQQAIAIVSGRGNALQSAALAVNVDGHVLGQLSEVHVAFTERIFVRAEPGDEFGPLGQSRIRFVPQDRFRRMDPTVRRQICRQTFDGWRRFFRHQNSVRLRFPNVGISTIRHGPVEKMSGLEHGLVHFAVHQFVQVEDVALMR